MEEGWQCVGPCDNPECAQKIRELEEELTRLRSVGYDMLKQKGSWLASGTQPADLGLEFDSFFTHEVEDMLEVLERSDMESTDAREFLSNTFQDVYNTCKESVLIEMQRSLARVLVLPEEQESDEELYDICRAYGLLLNASSNVGQSSIRQQNCSKEVYDRLTVSDSNLPSIELKSLLDQMSQLACRLLETVPPLVSTAISDVPFCKDWHEQELEPVWKQDLVDYDLVYYRPILFFDYTGKVCQKGWVGNKSRETGRECGDVSDKSCSNGDQNGGVSGQRVLDVGDTAGVTSSVGKHTRKYLSYKKPILRVRTVSDSPQLEHVSPDTGTSKSADRYAQWTELSTVEDLHSERQKKRKNCYGFGVKSQF